MFRKFASSFGYKPNSPSSVIITYGKSRFRLEFEPDDFQSTGPTLGFLRDKVGEAVKIPSKDVVLICNGRKLTRDQDGQYLSDLGIYTDAKILATKKPSGEHAHHHHHGHKHDKSNTQKDNNGSKAEKKNTKPAVKSNEPEVPKKLTGKELIQKILDDTEKELGPSIQDFVDNTPTNEHEKEDKHRRLSEMVLQKMFLLDDIEVEGDQELRLFRKEAINKLHHYHTRLDKAKTGKIEPGEIPE